MNGINKNQTLKMLTPLHENNPWRLHQKSPPQKKQFMSAKINAKTFVLQKVKKIRQKSKDTRNVGLS